MPRSAPAGPPPSRLSAGAPATRPARPLRGRAARGPRRAWPRGERRSTRPSSASDAQRYLDDDAYAARFARSRLAHHGLRAAHGSARVCASAGSAREQVEAGLVAALRRGARGRGARQAGPALLAAEHAGGASRAGCPGSGVFSSRGFAADLVRRRLRALWPRWSDALEGIEPAEARTTKATGSTDEAQERSGIDAEGRRRDPQRLPALLRGARPPRRQELVPRAPERPDAAVRQRRHEPVQGRLPGPGEARLHPGRLLPEVRARRRQAQRPRERGRTARHHTFFEMLGNFSFGDYFKKEAIAFAWEFLTRDLGLAPERLKVTVFEGEEGVPRDGGPRALAGPRAGGPNPRARGEGQLLGDGRHRPLRPLLRDPLLPGGPPPLPRRGRGRSCAGVECECDRWLEIWNLVFMQFDRDEEGRYKPLPAPCVDTGMGLERVAAVVQGKLSNYDTTCSRPCSRRSPDAPDAPTARTPGPTSRCG